MIGLTIGLALGRDLPSTDLDSVLTLNERAKEAPDCTSHVTDAFNNCRQTCKQMWDRFDSRDANSHYAVSICDTACRDGYDAGSEAEQQNLKDHLDHDMDMEDEGDQTSKSNERKKGKKKGKKKGGKQGEPLTCEAWLLKAKEACGNACDRYFSTNSNNDNIDNRNNSRCKSACSKFKKTV